MRAQASRALTLANKAISKGFLSKEKKAAFIDNLMSDKSGIAFEATRKIVDEFVVVASADDGKTDKTAGKITARDLLKQASAGPGLKFPIQMQSSAAPGEGSLKEQLESAWRKPPTLK